MLLALKGHQQRVHLDINKQNSLYINNIQTSPFSAYLRMDASLFVYTQIISRMVVKIIFSVLIKEQPILNIHVQVDIESQLPIRLV